MFSGRIVVGSLEYFCRNTQGTITTSYMYIVGGIEQEIILAGETLANPFFADNLVLFVPTFKEYSRNCYNPYPSVDGPGYGLLQVMGLERYAKNRLEKSPKNR